MSEAAVLECRGLTKQFAGFGQIVRVLDGIDLKVAAGTHVAIVGASGSGKSTLLHLLGGLDQASSGRVLWAGHDLAGQNPRQIGALRNRMLGFVYQFHHLLSEFTALENVAMPLRIARLDQEQAALPARRLLEAVGLGNRLQHRPAELSGGERQRAAVARALVTQPTLVLADEPTGNLDRHSALQVFELMTTLTRQQGAALIMVTHDSELAARADLRYRLVDGGLQPT